MGTDSKKLPVAFPSLDRARASLEGLTVGDAFGQCYFGHTAEVEKAIRNRALKKPPWLLTDDSIMAFSVYESLERFGSIEEDWLAKKFAERYMSDPRRGYGMNAHDALTKLFRGESWRQVAANAFGGKGSYGNGGAMRSAPIGAFFGADFDRIAVEARKSAEVTHAHPEGQAGAVAIALAAGWVASKPPPFDTQAVDSFWDEALSHTPAGATREGLEMARSLSAQTPIETAANILGNGSRVSAQDTVPFSIWCAARHLGDYEEALWTTVAGLGDRDTTCAMVGGIIAASPAAVIPGRWLDYREPLHSWLEG